MTIDVKKKLIVTTTAKRDLRKIRQYIQQDSPHEAKLFAADLATKIKWIAQVDFTGSPREHVGEGLRAAPYRGRCIYFRSFPDHIVIVRVLHGAQDVTRQEFEGKDV